MSTKKGDESLTEFYLNAFRKRRANKEASKSYQVDSKKVFRIRQPNKEVSKPNQVNSKNVDDEPNLSFVQNTESTVTWAAGREVEIPQHKEKKAEVVIKKKVNVFQKRELSWETPVKISFKSIPKKQFVPTKKSSTYTKEQNEKSADDEKRRALIKQCLKRKDILATLQFDQDTESDAPQQSFSQVLIGPGQEKGEKIILFRGENQCPSTSFYHFIEPLKQFCNTEKPCFEFIPFKELFNFGNWKDDLYKQSKILFSNLENYFRTLTPAYLQNYVNNIKPILYKLELDPGFQKGMNVQNRFVNPRYLIDILKNTIRINEADDSRNSERRAETEVFQFYPGGPANLEVQRVLFDNHGNASYPSFIILPTVDLDTQIFPIELTCETAEEKINEINSLLDQIGPNIGRRYHMKSFLISFPNHCITVKIPDGDTNMFDLFDTQLNDENNRYTKENLFQQINGYIDCHRIPYYRVCFLLIGSEVENEDQTTEVSESDDFSNGAEQAELECILEANNQITPKQTSYLNEGSSTENELVEYAEEFENREEEEEN